MSKLILTSDAHLLNTFGHRYLQQVKPENFTYLHAEMPLRRLAPLTWKLDTVLQNSSYHELSIAAANLLFVDDMGRRIREQRERTSGSNVVASPGDFIVILPEVPARSQFRDRDLESWLEPHWVAVIYIGKKLPEDIAHIFQDRPFFPSRIEPAPSLAQMAIDNGDIKVSVFDALNLGLCVDGVQEFQERYFRSFSEVPMDWLVPHLDNRHVARLVRHKLATSNRRRPDQSDQLRQLACAFGVEKYI